jgi:hypothetical protein
MISDGMTHTCQVSYQSVQELNIKGITSTVSEDDERDFLSMPMR